MWKLDFIQDLPSHIVYIGLGFSSWLENIFPPIPGDTITAVGAFLVAVEKVSFVGVLISTTIGSTSGFMTLFILAKYLGRDFFLKKDYRFFKKEMILKAEERFRIHGYTVILLNRFLPGIRSVISIATGILKLNTMYALLLSAISATIWNLIWIYMGYLMGKNFDTVKEGVIRLMRNYNMIAGALVVAFGICLFIFKKFRKK